MAPGDAEKRYRKECEDDLKRTVVALDKLVNPTDVNAQAAAVATLDRKVKECFRKWEALKLASQVYLDKIKMNDTDNATYLEEKKVLDLAYVRKGGCHRVPSVAADHGVNDTTLREIYLSPCVLDIHSGGLNWISLYWRLCQSVYFGPVT